MHDSLVARITLAAVAWITGALAVTAWILSSIYLDQSRNHFDDHVEAHLGELVAGLATDATGNIVLRAKPSDPGYEQPGSGWYWQVTEGSRMLASSPSLGANRLNPDVYPPGAEIAKVDGIGPDGKPLRIHAARAQAPGTARSLLVMSSAPAVHLTAEVKTWQRHLVLSFLVLAVGLAGGVILQVRFALQPLKRIEQRIEQIRKGQAEQIGGRVPRELDNLVSALNELVQHNTFLLRRARTQVGDLAHALKGPLAVIKNEARALSAPQRELLEREVNAIAESIEHYLSRARHAGRNPVVRQRTSVREVVENLQHAMGKVHADQSIVWQCETLSGCVFGGDAEDLHEMIGNLLDNAVKWADHRVWVSCRLECAQMRLSVEDDGPGIPAWQRRFVMQRGTQIDAACSGHGLGLSIVKELASLYAGKLVLSESRHGGLCATLVLPATDACARLEFQASPDPR